MTILASAAGNIPSTALIAALGYGVVFLGLIFLMLVVILVSKSFAKKARQKKEAAAQALAAQNTPAPEAPVAPGAAGQLKLYNVEPKTAAMLMAIVANKLDKPLNELRFISIREVL